MKKKILNSHKEAAGKTPMYLLAAALCGSGVFAGVFCLLAFAMCRADIPIKLLPALASFAACISVLLAAYVFAFLVRKHGLLFGLLFGAALFLLLWVAAALQGSFALTSMAAAKAAAMMLAGALGGYFGVIRSEKRKKIH